MRIKELDTTLDTVAGDRPAVRPGGTGDAAAASPAPSWAERELLRLNRALRVLSACNRAVTTSRDEPELLQQVCRLVVDVGGYRTVWVSYAEADAAKTVRPVAHAGGIGPYLDQLKLTWGDGARGRGPTGTAIRTGRPQASQQILTDPHFIPWRDAAVAEGYRAVAALPLLVEGKAIGALSVCAFEPEAFDRQELELLQQTADDLAQGIALRRADAQRRQADEAVRQAERVAREHSALITAALESLRLAPSADSFVRDALSTIVSRLGGCGGALWMAGEGLHDTRVAIDYDLHRFRSGSELSEDHPGKHPQPFPPGLVQRWRQRDAEPAILDADQLDGSTDQCALFRAWASRLGIRSVLLVPLIFGDDVLGALTVRFSEQRDCSAEELRLAKALAQQATLVLRLAHLSRQARESAVMEERERVAQERAARLESANAALQRTLSHLVNAQDSVALLDHIMHEAAVQMQASMTGVYLYDEATDMLRLASCVSENEVVDLARDERFLLWRTAAPAAAVQTWRSIMRSEHYAWFTTTSENHAAPGYLLNWHRAMGHRSLLAVPLKLGDRALGFVGMFFAHERLPDEDGLELARVFGQQAALAAQMADLAERAKQAAVSDERLAQLVRTNEALTHTLDRLATESSLDTALGDMLIAISQHLGAPSSTLWLHDVDNACGRLHLVYDRGRLLPGRVSGHPNAIQPLPIDRSTPVFRQLFEGTVGVVNADPAAGVDPRICEHLREQGVNSVLAIPMKAGGLLIGSCMVRLGDAGEVTAEQVEFARILVQQATLLLEVTRLAEAGQQAALSRERERIATEKAVELQAINEALRRAEQIARAHTSVITNTLQSITREPTLDSFIGQVLKAIVEQLGGVGGTFWEPSVVPDALVARLTFEHGKLERANASSRASWQLPACPQARDGAAGCEPMVLGQACTAAGPGAAAVRDWVREQGCGSALHVPLVIGSRLLGACTVRFAEPRDFLPEELTLARALALQATLALQLARLEEQGRRSAVLDERNRMARDIHDTLAQGFTGVVIQLEAAKDANASKRPDEAHAHIQRASELARQSLAEARRSVHALRPLALQQGSLGTALEGLLNRMTAGTGIEANLDVVGQPWEMPAEWEDNLLHIGQEALANALKHARPKRLSVTLQFEDSRISLTISDDGCGFEASRSAAGFGLAGMRERVQRLGGRLVFRSVPGDGTAVVVALERPSAAELPQMTEHGR